MRRRRKEAGRRGDILHMVRLRQCVFDGNLHHMPPHALTLWSSALVAQWIEHGSPKAGVGGSIPLWGTT